MLRAVLEDLHHCPGVEAVTRLDRRLARESESLRPARVEVHDPGIPEKSPFCALAAAADWSLVIAPESQDLLATRCAWVGEAGGRLLGPSSRAVRRAGDKLGLAAHLAGKGIPTPTTTLYPPTPEVRRRLLYPLVCKPRQGAGSQATFLLKEDADLDQCQVRAHAEGWDGDLFLQRFVPGLPTSVAFLIGPGQRIALPPAEQAVSQDGRFHYQGGRVPLPEGLAVRARGLADRAVTSFPGLFGYCGVDLVLGPEADGSGDRVLEINPRLTTSYVGLRALARFNLAEALLAVASGANPGSQAWRAGRVHFRADGRLWHDESDSPA